MADKIGYDDTPVIKGQTWKVHDCERPQPRIVTSGELATQAAPAVPPSDAIVLFDDQAMNTLKQLFDAVIELEESADGDEPTIRTAGLSP